jgi:hypothetical protein
MYQTGDILFFNSIPTERQKWYMRIFTKLQNKFDGKASHVEIVYLYDHDNNKVITFGTNADGIKLREHAITKEVAIGRVKGIDVRKADYVLNLMLSSRLGEPYSWKGLINASLNAVLDKLFPKLWNKKRIFTDSSKAYCSELVGEFIYMCMNKRLSRTNEQNIHDDNLSPSDIYRSKDIIILKDFG